MKQFYDEFLSAKLNAKYVNNWTSELKKTYVDL